MNLPNCQTNKWICRTATGKSFEFDGRACAALHLTHKGDTWTTRGMEVYHVSNDVIEPPSKIHSD